MATASSELSAALAGALASGDEALVVAALVDLGRSRLAAGQRAAALAALREAAERAAPLGEGVLGRALGELGAGLSAIGQHELADRTLVSALAHLRRAGDLEGSADVALARARGSVGDGAEAAWADASRRCAAAGREAEERGAGLAAARLASGRGDGERALQWLQDLVPRLDAVEDGGEDAAWARGELGALWLERGRTSEASPLLARAAREEVGAGRDAAAARRLHQLGRCLATLGDAAVASLAWQSAIERWRAAGDSIGEATTELELAEALVRTGAAGGRRDEAVRRAERALVLACASASASVAGRAVELLVRLEDAAARAGALGRAAESLEVAELRALAERLRGLALYSPG